MTKVKMTDHETARYLRSRGVNWEATQKEQNANEFYDGKGKLICVQTYNDAGSEHIATYID